MQRLATLDCRRGQPKQTCGVCVSVLRRVTPPPGAPRGTRAEHGRQMKAGGSSRARQCQHKELPTRVCTAPPAASPRRLPNPCCCLQGRVAASAAPAPAATARGVSRHPPLPLVLLCPPVPRLQLGVPCGGHRQWCCHCLPGASCRWTSTT